MRISLRSNTLHPGRPDKNSRVRLLLRSGRERAQFKRWWNSGSNHKNYIDCSAAELETEDGCKYLLVWPHNYDSRLDVTWSVKHGTITFTKIRRVKHIALMCLDGTVLTHWVSGNTPGVKPKPYQVNDSCPDGCTPGGGSGGGGDSCNTDDDCPPGFICENGVCVPDPGLPTDRCWTIPELPTIDTDEPKAPLSTSLFTVCTDIPNLPDLQ